jgi:hypothetical protein
MPKWVSNRVSDDSLVDDTGAHTGWFIACDHHWDTDTPIVWKAIRCGKEFPFPTKKEAMDFAEVTYELERNP